MKSERRNEITRLKLPSGKWTINNFEPNRQPIRGFERRVGIQAFHSNRLLQAENNLGFDLQRARMCERQRGGVFVAVMHGVLIHVGPNQSFKFENTPQGL